MADAWKFWIDVGGTFTDCIAVTPSGALRQFKTLSSGVVKGTAKTLAPASITDPQRSVDPAEFWTGATCRLISGNGTTVQTTTCIAFEKVTGTLLLSDALTGEDIVAYELNLHLPAPVLAIRWLLDLKPAEQCPPVRVRFGTTRGTNALLTRQGARTALITTRGFGDVPLIGNQDRPDLFDLNIKKPEPLVAQVFEVDERIDAQGRILRNLNCDQETRRLVDSGIVPDKFDSVAICFLNGYRNTIHEQKMESLVRKLGFAEVSRSSEVSPLIRFVPRCDTTVLDAYLNPVLRQYLEDIRRHLPGSELQVMTSTGGLVGSHSFRGRDCILSGPAGGIVGFSQVATGEGFEKSIGFDMGGTSTDVARFDGRFDFENETTKAGVRIMSPVLAIETVAAGGGSICGFDGTRLFVGPQSAGADPGPACYGAGGPLTVTDLNVFLGRVLPEHFPFPLDKDAITKQLTQLQLEMEEAGLANTNSLQRLAEGLLQIANDNMVQAIRRVSVAKGYHPTEYALVSFGGAGGQHACSIARSLGINTVLVHPFAGILSAFGIGQADVKAIRQISVLQTLNENTLKTIDELRRQLKVETERKIRQQGISREHSVDSTLSLELRYTGTDSALTIDEPQTISFREAFEIEHERLFGYRRSHKAIEVTSLRVESIGKASHTGASAQHVQGTAALASETSSTIWFDGRAHSARIISRSSLQVDDQITGPAIICEPTSTVFVEPGCYAVVSKSGTIRISIAADTAVGQLQPENNKHVDPVLLEVYNNQFVSIAEQMGETLRRTSTSTNVRERLDFSCALFDNHGALVVNAPHVPVHLGAMGETVRAIVQDHPDMYPGDVFVTNDPYRGGSHLPDVTVVTPVFISAENRPAFFVANRAHHAEIGGIVPGSMPPFSTNLAQEGILICSRKLVDSGESCEPELQRLLESGPYPSRSVSDNLADLAAQAAANECGARQLRDLVKQRTVETVQAYMQHIQAAAANKMRQCLQRMDDRAYMFRDQLDDGTQIVVRITVQDDRATIDFSGTAGVHSGNLNANRAITTAAVLYSFRCLLNENVPLNAGVLEPLEIIIPKGLLNPTPGKTAAECPAIVGGNVETSQRIVDVLLGALGLAAASQGTMNNLTFGDETFGYYETICGGAGASAIANGADAVHTHMTNTRLTDPEVLEQRYPVRLLRFAVRRSSGGAGRFRGGNGIVREIEFLKPLHVSMLSQRRGTNRPYGLSGGDAGHAGNNSINGVQQTNGCFAVQAETGTVLKIETPGGGGFGHAAGQSPASG